MIETLEGGRDAFARHAWTEAIEAFTAADRDGGLSPEDLELLSSAQWWSGHPDEATEGLERAFTAYSDAGRGPEGAWVAMTLAYQAFQRVAGPVGGGWLARAERLLADEPESKMHARLGVFRSFGAIMAGQLEAAIAGLDRAMEIAKRHDDPNALYMAMSFKGLGQVLTGNWQDGLANIDESAAAAGAGELNLRIASDIYCNTIAACRNVGDLGRAAQWAG